MISIFKPMTYACFLITFTGILMGCSSEPEPPITSTQESPSSSPQTLPTATATAECRLISPSLDRTEPARVAPLEEVSVFGSGGYQLCDDGFHNESARSFALFFNQEPVGAIGCYVNHCQVTFKIPANTEPGEYTFSVESGTSITIEVTTAKEPK